MVSVPVPVSAKEWSKIAYPKALLSIIASVGGLAVFLMLASTLLVPFGDGSEPSLSYWMTNAVDSGKYHCKLKCLAIYFIFLHFYVLPSLLSFSLSFYIIPYFLSFPVSNISTFFLI